MDLFSFVLPGTGQEVIDPQMDVAEPMEDASDLNPSEVGETTLTLTKPSGF